MSEQVAVELDDETARWVHRTADRRGVGTAEVIATQLRELRESRVDELLDEAEAEREAAVHAELLG
jgi:hypothetical protein